MGAHRAYAQSMCATSCGESLLVSQTLLLCRDVANVMRDLRIDFEVEKKIEDGLLSGEATT